jgi:hypothetical protein
MAVFGGAGNCWVNRVIDGATKPTDFYRRGVRGRNPCAREETCEILLVDRHAMARDSIVKLAILAVVTRDYLLPLGGCFIEALVQSYHWY